MFYAQSTITVRSGRRGYRRERKSNELSFIQTLQLNSTGLARPGITVPSLPLPILWSRRQRPSRMAIFRPWSGSLGLLSRGLKRSVSHAARVRETHTPGVAFRHLPPWKDVVNQCLEFARDTDLFQRIQQPLLLTKPSAITTFLQSDIPAWHSQPKLQCRHHASVIDRHSTVRETASRWQLLKIWDS